jgi:hypothetical protein
MNKLDTLLKAINLAHYDNLKTVEVSLEDLVLLRSTILELQDQAKRLKEVEQTTRIKLALEQLDKPVKLSIYA